MISIVIVSQDGEINGITGKFSVFVGDKMKGCDKYPIMLEQFVYRGDEIILGAFSSENDANEITRQITIAIIKEQKVYEIPQDGMIEYSGR